ncbi:MAG TPA: alkaline phosphatase family protein [Polyangia bacterium]
MAQQPLRHRSGFVLAISLALLPWLGCSPSGSSPTDLDGGVTGTGGTQTGGAGGSTGASGRGGTTGQGAGGPGGSIGTGPAGTTGTGTAGNHGTAGGSPTAGSTGTTTGTAGTTGTSTGTAGSTGTTTGTAGSAGTTTGAAGSTGTTTGTAGTTGTTTGAAGTTGSGGTTAATGKIKNVFVIAMENEPASAIYGDKKAPYLNGLMAKYAHATAFTDPLPDSIPSEPHYVWMEAGTNKFSDVTFTGDGDPSSGNSTKNTAHLTTQMNAASPPITWMGAMEGLNSSTGACPVSSSGFYAAKHDPFVFFQDVAGSPPSKSNALCGAHHQAFTTGQALVAGTVAQYTFIAPNVCNDMHGDSSCPAGDVIAMGDAWLASNLPPLIDYANAHAGVIFIVWDEPEGGSPVMPFFAIGPNVKPGYTSSVTFTHSSLLKTVEEIFGLPVLPTVAGATDFADLFQPGTLP